VGCSVVGLFVGIRVVGLLVGVRIGLDVGLFVGRRVLGIFVGRLVGLVVVGFGDVGLDVGFFELIDVVGDPAFEGEVQVPRDDTWLHILALTRRGSIDTVPSPARGEFE